MPVNLTVNLVSNLSLDMLVIIVPCAKTKPSNNW